MLIFKIWTFNFILYKKSWEKLKNSSNAIRLTPRQNRYLIWRIWNPNHLKCGLYLDVGLCSFSGFGFSSSIALFSSTQNWIWTRFDESRGFWKWDIFALLGDFCYVFCWFYAFKIHVVFHFWQELSMQKPTLFEQKITFSEKILHFHHM